MALRALQQDLQQCLMGHVNTVAARILEAPPLPVEQRLAIYKNAYEVRLVEALRDTHPKLHALLGDEDFAALGEAFIHAYPSVHRSIRWYGAELATFLVGHPPYDALPIVAELATLEWQLAAAFDAPDAEPLTRTALAAIDPQRWSDLKFRFHPSLSRLAFEWNTVAVWQALSHDSAVPEPERSACVPWLLWRQGYKNYFRSLPDAEAAALDAAQRGATFAQVCAALDEFLPQEQIPLAAAQWLGAWTDSGIIIALD